LRNRVAELSELEQEQQDIIDKIGVQYKDIAALMDAEDLFSLLAGGGGKKTPESATAGVKEQADIMADLAKQLKVIEARSDALDLTVVEEDNEKLKAYTTALEALIEAGVDGADVAANLSYVADSVGELNGSIENAEGLMSVGDILANLDKATQKVIDTFAGMSGPEANLKRLQANAENVRKALEKMREQNPGATAEIAALAAEYAKLTEGVKQAELSLEQYQMRQEMIRMANDAMVDGFFNLGQAMTQVGDATKSMARRVLEAAASTISALVKQLYVQFATQAIAKGGHPLASIALLGVGAGAISGFLNSIPQLAQGGIAVGPQLAVVGDNRSGREAIIPLEKLPGLMQKMGGGGNGRLYGTIDGYDLVLTNERNNRLMQRASR